MISRDYRQNKKQVLALYNDFKKACEGAEKKVSSNIEMQAQKIRDEVFNLMILGEAKSGKSTFINAYLGKEVVPMDVRQCTSAIIKIKRGDEFKLVAKTAAGGQTIITGDENIREFLKAHASIPDKYRNIPITTINNEILIKYKDKKIPREIMKTFLEAEAVDNIFNMNIGEYNRLIEEYIKEKKNSWGKIITEIEIIYPLPEAMQGITLIDSPGVGAGGNVGAITEEYIKNATVNKLMPESKMIMSSVYNMMMDDTLSEESFQNPENRTAFYQMDILKELNNKFSFDVPDKINYSESKNELDKWIKSGSAAVVIVGGAVSVKFKSFVPFGISLAIVIVAIMGLLVSNKSRSNDKTNINLLISEYLASVQTSLMAWIKSIESYYDERIEELKKGMNT